MTVTLPVNAMIVLIPLMMAAMLAVEWLILRWCAVIVPRLVREALLHVKDIMQDRGDQNDIAVDDEDKTDEFGGL